jgi:hypothetical protein
MNPESYGDRIANVYDSWYDNSLDTETAVDFLSARLVKGGCWSWALVPVVSPSGSPASVTMSPGSTSRKRCWINSDPRIQTASVTSSSAT